MKLTSNVSGFIVNDPFYFEAQFEPVAAWGWLGKHWTYPFWYSLSYVLLVFGGKRYMADKERFDLRGSLTVWSGLLAVFSIFGAVRTSPELFYVVRKFGLGFSICDASYAHGPTGVWLYFMAISKVFELGDTVFIVLRKQRLLFLHWYHHVTALLYCWLSCMDPFGPGRWLMVMNYTVHAFMYTYYTARVMRILIPEFVRMSITSLQMLQFVVAVYVNVHAFVVKGNDGDCQVSYRNIQYSLVMYGSYVVLFGAFFYAEYIAKKPSSKRQVKSKSE